MRAGSTLQAWRAGELRGWPLKLTVRRPGYAEVASSRVRIDMPGVRRHIQRADADGRMRILSRMRQLPLAHSSKSG